MTDVPRSRTHARLSRVVSLAASLGVALAALAAGSAPAPAFAARGSEAGASVVGGDVSWPQCPKGMGIKGRESLGLPMPGKAAQFVVVGVTNGPGFTANPCLASQVAWARSRNLPVGAYSVISYPLRWQLLRHAHHGPWAGRTLQGRLFNVGYAQARRNLTTMRAAGLQVPHIWLDVEVYPFRPWTSNLTNNRYVVRGALRAYRDAGLSRGIYSTPSQLASIIGHPAWRLPEWHTAGPRGRASALAHCSEASFNGGPVVLAQWWSSTADHDLTCPDHAGAALTRYFRAAP